MNVICGDCEKEIGGERMIYLLAVPLIGMIIGVYMVWREEGDDDAY